jgi:hypothetical protein
MLNIVSKIQESLSGKSEANGKMTFTFIQDKQEIFKALSNSLQRGTVIGVYSRALGEGLFLTGVDDIEHDGPRTTIVFETYDISGKPMPKTRIDASDIKTVCPFQIEYINPLLGKVKHIVVDH